MNTDRTLALAISLATLLAACSDPQPTTDLPPSSNAGSAGAHGASTGQPSGSLETNLPESPSGGLYEPLKPLAHERLGTVLRSERLAAPDGIRAWAVLYVSTGLHGSRTAVSDPGSRVGLAARRAADRRAGPWPHRAR